MLLIKSLRWLFSIIKIIDHSNLFFFRMLSPKTKRQLVRRFYRPLTSLLPRTIELNGLSFYVPSDLDATYVLQEYEPETQGIIGRHLTAGMNVLDVGANIGYLTLLAARQVIPGGKVYAVEPCQDNLELLRQNIQLNNFTNIDVLPYAAGAEHRHQNFYLYKASTLHSLHARDDITSISTSVPVVPLDDIIKDQIDFVKIDVEGAEIETLKGMAYILQSNPELELIVEWNPSALHRAGYSAEKLPELLRKAGFDLTVIDDDQAQPLQTVEEVIEKLRSNQLSVSWHANLYAKRNPIKLL